VTLLNLTDKLDIVALLVPVVLDFKILASPLGRLEGFPIVKLLK
jgi:hypothetical protein